MKLYKIVIVIVVLSVLAGGLAAIIKLGNSASSSTKIDSVAEEFSVTIFGHRYSDSDSIGEIETGSPINVAVSGATSFDVCVVPADDIEDVFYLDGDPHYFNEISDFTGAFKITGADAGFSFTPPVSIHAVLESTFPYYEVVDDCDSDEGVADCFCLVVTSGDKSISISFSLVGANGRRVVLDVDSFVL